MIGGKAKATFFFGQVVQQEKQKKPMCIWNNGELLYLGLSVSVFCFYGLYATLSSQFLLARVCVFVLMCAALCFCSVLSGLLNQCHLSFTVPLIVPLPFSLQVMGHFSLLAS